MRGSMNSPRGIREHVLLSHVLTALLKWPPSICAHSDVKSRFRRSATGSGAFFAGCFFTLLVLPFCGGADVVLGFGGMACGDKLWTGDRKASRVSLTSNKAPYWA